MVEEGVSDPINRAQFLRGDLHGERLAIRPPWAKTEARFIELCSRCDDCINGCPQQIIRRGAGGYPQIDFRTGACTFCGDCVRACRHDALAFSSDPSQPAWSLKIEIKSDCLARNGVVCRSCAERCEERAIRFQLQIGGRALPEVDAAACSGCGECVGICPSGSIQLRPLAHTKAA
jgi:ferredoxin-type protein NapF